MSHLGVLFGKGQLVIFRLPLYYICASLTPHAVTAPFAWQAAESNSAPFAVLHVSDVCRWTWQLLLRGSFSKGSTGRRVKRLNGSTGHFHFHYIIYDSRRRQAHATPLQKHTAYDDTRLTPHRCKKHTASFSRLTGKFPSKQETLASWWVIWNPCKWAGERSWAFNAGKYWNLLPKEL